MVESIKELEKICLPNRKVRGRVGEHWITSKLQRKASIRFTWLLLHTPISANQTSMLGFMIGVLGALLISANNYNYTILAVIALYLAEVLDSCDGEIARYRKTSGKKGEMLEGLFNPSMIHALFFIGIAVNAYSTFSNPAVFVTAAIGVLFAVKLDHAKELAKEYQSKKFHASVSDSIMLVTKTPLQLFKFLGESKHLRHMLILLAAVFSQLYIFIIVYPLLVALAYFAFSIRFLHSVKN